MGMANDGRITVCGVVAMNGAGEMCFFAHSRGDGLPILGADGRAMTSALAHLPREVKAATRRHVSHDALVALDPPEGGD